MYGQQYGGLPPQQQQQQRFMQPQATGYPGGMMMPQPTGYGSMNPMGMRPQPTGFLQPQATAMHAPQPQQAAPPPPMPAIPPQFQQQQQQPSSFLSPMSGPRMQPQATGFPQASPQPTGFQPMPQQQVPQMFTQTFLPASVNVTSCTSVCILTGLYLKQGQPASDAHVPEHEPCQHAVQPAFHASLRAVPPTGLPAAERAGAWSGAGQGALGPVQRRAQEL